MSQLGSKSPLLSSPLSLSFLSSSSDIYLSSLLSPPLLSPLSLFLLLSSSSSPSSSRILSKVLLLSISSHLTFLAFDLFFFSPLLLFFLLFLLHLQGVNVSSLSPLFSSIFFLLFFFFFFF